MLRYFKPIAAIVCLAAQPQQAEAYDMDCAILLCMAGGFPSSAVCAAAYAEMIRRITPWPSRPPFGICTYAAAPVAFGGPGGEREVDTSTPEFDWLDRTRVIWWRGRHWDSHRDEQEYWSWSLRSCDGENRSCRSLTSASQSTSPWPTTFETENGHTIEVPAAGPFLGITGRAIMIEYGDYTGAVDHTDWVRY